MEQLFKEGAISRQQLDDVTANHDATAAQLVAAEAAIQQANDAVLSSKMTKKMKEAQLVQANANLNASRVLLEDAFIKAPFGGIITRRDFDIGAMATPVKPIFKLEQMNPVKIIGSLIERDLHQIEAGKTIAIISLDTISKDFRSTVKKIYPSINNVSRTGKLEIHLENSDLQIRSGMFAHIKLLLETKSNVVIVPRDSLMSYKSNLYAFKVENGKAKKVKVSTGLKQGHLIEITDGLSTGDIIISEGLEFIREGSRVKVILEEPIK
jgi:RND family efflux transporter MFP subunit